MISGLQLAWYQLRRQKVRLAVALAGVAFAVTLMTVQLGFQDALFRSAVTVHQRLRGDLFMFHPQYNCLAFPKYFPRVRLYQALGFDGVTAVIPLYTTLAPWKNPATGKRRDLFMLGVDPSMDVFDTPAVRDQRYLLRQPDVVLYDRLSRAEFGPVGEMFDRGDLVETEVGQRAVRVAGLFEMGTSFGVDATLLTSDLNFLRMNRDLTLGHVSIGIVRLAPGIDPRTVQARMRATLPGDVKILTRPEMLEAEVDYWARATPIGFVFSFGVMMGLVVGMIIVYQILFADIADHLKEYATLKAIGYTNRCLSTVVLMEATILGAVGFVPGVAICRGLYDLTQRATNLPMALEPLRLGQILVMTLVMCWVSAMIAMRKLRAADPADVF
jgi:putative ABC transport system permease protein